MSNSGSLGVEIVRSGKVYLRFWKDGKQTPAVFVCDEKGKELSRFYFYFTCTPTVRYHCTPSRFPFRFYFLAGDTWDALQLAMSILLHIAADPF